MKDRKEHTVLGICKVFLLAIFIFVYSCPKCLRFIRDVIFKYILLTPQKCETHKHLSQMTAYLDAGEKEGHVVVDHNQLHLPSLPNNPWMASRQEKTIGHVNTIRESKLWLVLAKGKAIQCYPKGSEVCLDDSQPYSPTRELWPLGDFCTDGHRTPAAVAD